MTPFGSSRRESVPRQSRHTRWDSGVYLTDHLESGNKRRLRPRDLGTRLKKGLASGQCIYLGSFLAGNTNDSTGKEKKRKKQSMTKTWQSGQSGYKNHLHTETARNRNRRRFVPPSSPGESGVQREREHARPRLMRRERKGHAGDSNSPQSI